MLLLLLLFSTKHEILRLITIESFFLDFSYRFHTICSGKKCSYLMCVHRYNINNIFLNHYWILPQKKIMFSMNVNDIKIIDSCSLFFSIFFLNEKSKQKKNKKFNFLNFNFVFILPLNWLYYIIFFFCFVFDQDILTWTTTTTTKEKETLIPETMMMHKFYSFF